MKKLNHLFCALSMTLSLLALWSPVSLQGAEEPATASATSSTTNPALNRLQLKEKRLIAELKSLDKDDPDFLILSQSIHDELTLVRQQIQDATAVKASPRLDIGSMVPEQSILSMTESSAVKTIVPDPNSGTVQASPLPVGPAGLFAQIKKELNLQLKQVQQMQQTIDRHDGRLWALLQEQEKDVLNQLREVDRQIAEISTTQGPVSQLPMKASENAEETKSQTMPGNDGNLASSDGFPIKVKTQADAAPSTVVVPPNSTYSWAPAPRNDSALTPARDPFAAAPAPEILEIRKMVIELKEEMSKLQTELTAINTQLRLLSFHVAGGSPAPEANAQPAVKKQTIDSSAKPADTTTKPAVSHSKTDKK